MCSTTAAPLTPCPCPLEARHAQRSLVAALFSIAVELTGGVPVQPATPADADPPAAQRITHDGYFKQRPVWSPDGKRLVFARHQRDKIWLHTTDATGRDEKRLTNREHPEYDAAWSPDGKRLAFTLVNVAGTQGDVDLHVVNADGSGLARIAGSDGGLSHEEWPSWSPDGKRVAFTSTRAGNQEVFAADVDGKNQTRLTTDLGTDAHPAWSPDGRHIAFASDRWGGLEIALMNADGSDVRRLTTSAGLDDYPAWSPDGRQIAFTSNRDGNLEIYVMSPDGSHVRNLTQSPAIDNFPTWTPDGRAVTFVSNRDRRWDIYTIDVAGGR
jgi:TolB protein